MANTALAGKTPITDPAKVAQFFGVDASGNIGPMAPAVAKTAMGAGSGGGSAPLLLTANPTVATDSSVGAVQGGFALNTKTRRAFYCVDATAGAAIWEPLGIGRHPGYLAGSAYYPEGMKVNGANPGTIVPSTAGRIYFAMGTIAERVAIPNFLVKASSGVAGTLAQVGIYKIDPATKRPIGAVLANTADIDCSATGTKSAAPAAAFVPEPGPYAWGFMVNQASGSTFTALDTSDGTAAQSWGFATPADIFGLVTGVIYAGTYGVWPNFASGATFSAGYAAVPAMAFVAGAPS